MSRRSTVLAVLPAVIALVMTACSGAEPRPQAARNPSPTMTSSSSPIIPSSGPTYVALGDSFTAGGTIGQMQRRGFRCGRSTQNYPSIVATTLDLPLTDVSCGGATSSDVLEGSRGLPAQIDAIRPRTRVVTVSIGGNDFSLYAQLMLTCSQVSGPKEATGAPCRDRLGQQIDPIIPSIGTRVGDVLDRVQEKAPQATVLLVGYPRLMPESGSCRRAPYTPDDMAWVASLEAELAAGMRSAARRRDIAFVDMYARSKGHDLCQGKDAWVNGLDPAAGDGLVLHPNAAGEQAIARAVIATVRAER